MTTVILNATARSSMLRTARGNPHAETGGILIGHYNDDRGETIVTHALEVPDPAATGTTYQLRVADAQRALDQHLGSAFARPHDGYVGDWHSHPAAIGPSRADRRALRSAKLDSGRPTVQIVCYAGAEARFWALEASGRLRRTHAATLVSTADRLLSLVGPLPAAALKPGGPTFISYRQSDGTPRADEIETLLRASGAVVWRDRTDLGPGNTEDRLERALTAGLASAVLIVTDDIKHSRVVQQVELPRLLQLDEHPTFALTIANDIPGQRTGPDYAAPDRLLGLLPDTILADKKQANSRRVEGLREIAADIIRHRLEGRRAAIEASGSELSIAIQTRSATTNLDDVLDADLHFRTLPPSGKIPAPAAYRALQVGLPLASDAALAIAARRISIQGGAHLSIAIALGAAFPETRFGQVTILDTRGLTWTGPEHAECSAPAAIPVNLDRRAADGPVLVQIAFAPAPDLSAFDALASSGGFAAAYRIMSDRGHVDPNDGSALARSLANTVKSLCRESGSGELHLAFQGPFPLAVLLGRLLNTLRTTIYEWDDSGSVVTPRYVAVCVLQLGLANSPIVWTHNERERELALEVQTGDQIGNAKPALPPTDS